MGADKNKGYKTKKNRQKFLTAYDFALYSKLELIPGL